MHAKPNDDGSMTVCLRYEETHVVRSFEELMMTANYARHGRDYMNDAWVTLFIYQNKIARKYNVAYVCRW